MKTNGSISPIRFPLKPAGRHNVQVEGKESVLVHHQKDGWEEYQGGSIGQLGIWQDGPTSKRVKRDGFLGWLGFKKTVTEPANGEIDGPEVKPLQLKSSEGLDNVPFRDTPLPPPVQTKSWKAVHYKHELNFDESANLKSAESEIVAQAKRDTDEIVLDFGLVPTKVFNPTTSEPIEFKQKDDKLVLQHSVKEGEEFRIGVEYGGQPEARSHPSVPTDIGWLKTDGAVVTMNGLDVAHSWLPVDNDPSNKATYEFLVNTPENLTAAANGEMVDKKATESGSQYHFRTSTKMSPYLASVNVFDKSKYSRTKMDGGFEVIHPRGAEERVKESFANQAEMMTFLTDRLGPYPFATYNAVVADLPADQEHHTLSDGENQYHLSIKAPVAFEAQTLSIFENSDIHGEQAEDNIFHELAHQWFGNSVTKKAAKDIWVAEGFGRYSSRLWEEHKGKGEKVEAQLKSTYEALRTYEFTDTMANPDRDKLFSLENYGRMELSMHALRKKLGDDQFWASLRHITQTYKDQSISSEEMAETINQFNGGELGEFFESWLHSKKIPEMSF